MVRLLKQVKALNPFLVRIIFAKWRCYDWNDSTEDKIAKDSPTHERATVWMFTTNDDIIRKMKMTMPTENRNS